VFAAHFAQGEPAMQKTTAIVLGAMLAMAWALASLDAQTTTGAQGQGATAGQQQAGQAAQQGRGGRQAGPPSMGGGQCANNPYNCPDTPNPLPKADTVWLEEMTWMDVRDAMKAGKTTVIISTGGMEPNGPWLALGKHNYVLRSNCDAIARKLGDALCAPIVPFVPEGRHEPASGHMTTPGTISLTEETFAALLGDIVMSYKVGGFKNIIMIGDSGGNPTGMNAVAKKYTELWKGEPFVAHVPEHYTYSVVSKEMASRGLIKEGQGDGLHDDPIISLNMYNTDPKSIRYAERVKAGKASINGVSLADAKKNAEMAKAIVDFRSSYTAEAIKKAIANKGK
jgi:creatinine amidohydrolase/Fe(II)-dependent formamide hydrolase-like protein